MHQMTKKQTEKGNILMMVNYKSLMELGFKEHTARSVIREAKIKLVNDDGLIFYNNHRLGLVPTQKVEEILGIKFTDRAG